VASMSEADRLAALGGSSDDGYGPLRLTSVVNGVVRRAARSRLVCPLGTVWCVDHDSDQVAGIDVGLCEGPTWQWKAYWIALYGVRVVASDAHILCEPVLGLRHEHKRTHEALRRLSVNDAMRVVGTLDLLHSQGAELDDVDQAARRILPIVLQDLQDVLAGASAIWLSAVRMDGAAGVE
jgi:hypothetical protein